MGDGLGKSGHPRKPGEQSTQPNEDHRRLEADWDLWVFCNKLGHPRKVEWLGPSTLCHLYVSSGSATSLLYTWSK